jgi:hypothetical protein
MLDKYIAWVEAHERHLLILAAGVVLWVGIGKVDTLILHHDQAGLQQAQIVAAQQAQKNAEVLAVVQQQAVDLKALNDRVLSQQAALEQANVNLANALIQQKKTDATLPPTELAARWNTLVPAALVSVTPNGVSLSLPGAVATVQTLEEVPVLTQQLNGVKQELIGEKQIAAQQESRITSLNTLVAGKDASLKDAEKVCTEQIKVVKDEARKSKRKWFVAGVITGGALRGAVKILFGF